MKIDIEKLKKFEKLPPDVKRELSLVMAKWKEKKKQTDIRNDFMAFVKHVWPDFVLKEHITNKLQINLMILQRKNKTCYN
jgi:hypothetical protein